MLTVVKVQEIDRRSAPELRLELDAALAVYRHSVRADPGAPLVIDLRQVRFMDSTGIAALLHAHGQAQELGGSVGVLAEGPVQRVLEVTGLWEHFNPIGSHAA